MEPTMPTEGKPTIVRLSDMSRSIYSWMVTGSVMNTPLTSIGAPSYKLDGCNEGRGHSNEAHGYPTIGKLMTMYNDSDGDDV